MRVADARFLNMVRSENRPLLDPQDRRRNDGLHATYVMASRSNVLSTSRAAHTRIIGSAFGSSGLPTPASR